MRIVVPIKQVPETAAVRMDEATGTMIRENVEAIVNPLDLYAIELAIRIREAQPAGAVETVAVSMGPPKAMDALREAVAMGIDSAVLVSDKAFAGSDTWTTSYVLAEAIRRIGGPAGLPELVICGERATDGDTAQVPPGVAAWLDLPVVTYVSRLEACEAGRVTVRRLVEDGYEVLQADCPCVLTVVKEAASPRLPTLRGKIRAERLDIPVWRPADLDLRGEYLGLEGSPTRVVKIFRPKVARSCRMVVAGDEASTIAAADELIDFLQERNLL